VVEENWTGAGLGHGRSLNFYDASTGTWSQMWVSSGGCPTGVIIIEGTFANGSMTMTGRKEQPEGFVLGPPCAPPPPVVSFVRTNLIRWTRIDGGAVLQEFSASNNGDPLPPLGPVIQIRKKAAKVTRMEFVQTRVRRRRPRDLVAIAATVSQQSDPSGHAL